MSFKIIESIISGCFEIEFPLIPDHRGHFIKTYHVDLFKTAGIEFNVAEEYYSFSKKNVFRGLHFQLPPKDLDKLVYCVDGKINDYIVDLRIGSPTYGQHVCFELNSNNPKAIFIATGLAHGFHVLSDSALIQYKVSQVYSKECDTGVSYLSFPFAKEITNPIISERDQSFELLSAFNSPFKFNK